MVNKCNIKQELKERFLMTVVKMKDTVSTEPIYLPLNNYFSYFTAFAPRKVL